MSKAKSPQTPPTRLEFLIVTNELASCQLLTQAIGEVGGVERYADSVPAAKIHIAERKIEGAFLDVPAEAAFDLISDIRQSESNRFAVVFSCVDLGIEPGPLLRAGANFVLQKPLSQISIGKVMNVAMQMMVAEMRRYLRYELMVPVTLRNQRLEQRAVTANISRGGMAVKCREAYKPHAQVDFVLQLAGRQLPAQTEVGGHGEVVWSQPDGRMGIRFEPLPGAVQNYLWSWMEQQITGMAPN
ncbi:MAG TPA: PilZ domain-containing protein [Alphaproteobacteria bacterium]|nr:PilZ domain-containing protein [Alphaproteobacteria bacterium]